VRADGQGPEYNLLPLDHPKYGRSSTAVTPKPPTTQPQPYDTSTQKEAAPVTPDARDEKIEIRARANPFEMKINDAPSAIPDDDDASTLQRIVAAVSLRMRFFVWWVFEHFTLLCIAFLLILAFMPDHYTLTLTPTTTLVVITGIYIVRSTWSALPKWVQKHVRGEAPGEAEDANDDLASPTAIMRKLNEMFNLTYQHSDDLLPDDMPQYKIYVCVISLLHLLTELYHAYPDWRDKEMRDEGDLVSKKELQHLELYLDFADLAYEESPTELIIKLRTTGYQLIRHDVATEPGRVGHFMAVNHDKKEVVLAIKGTSSVSDVLTDLVGKAIPHTLADGKLVRCHEGMHTAATMMVEDTQHMIETFFRPPGYKVKICGHSLGAGVSCLLGVFLKSRGIDVEVMAFATPACLSYEASLECRDYVTSIINNSDCVPRVSLVNIRTLNKLFLKLDEKLTMRGLSPTNWKTTRAYINDVAKVDDDLLMTPEELHDFEEEAREAETGNDDYSLFVAGRVVSMWECNTEEKSADCRQMHGGMKTLRHIEVSTTMICDHGTEAYKGNLRLLIDNAKD